LFSNFDGEPGTIAHGPAEYCWRYILLNIASIHVGPMYYPLDAGAVQRHTEYLNKYVKLMLKSATNDFYIIVDPAKIQKANRLWKRIMKAHPGLRAEINQWVGVVVYAAQIIKMNTLSGLRYSVFCDSVSMYVLEMFNRGIVSVDYICEATIKTMTQYHTVKETRALLKNVAKGLTAPQTAALIGKLLKAHPCDAVSWVEWGGMYATLASGPARTLLLEMFMGMFMQGDGCVPRQCIYAFMFANGGMKYGTQLDGPVERAHELLRCIPASKDDIAMKNFADARKLVSDFWIVDWIGLAVSCGGFDDTRAWAVIGGDPDLGWIRSLLRTMHAEGKLNLAEPCLDLLMDPTDVDALFDVNALFDVDDLLNLN